MKNKMFRALVVHEMAGNHFERRIEEKRVDDLPAGDVLVRVQYSSLNYKDALSASGNRGVTRKYPHTPGIDAAGVVEESTVDEFKPGDEVIVSCYDLGMNTPGGFGQYIRVPAGWVVRLPEGLTLRQSMMIGTAGFTAAQSVATLMSHGVSLLSRNVSTRAGKVLVTGATGGVGSIAVYLLAKEGYCVVAVTGKPEAERYLLDIGASEILLRDKAKDTSDRMMLKGKWAGVIDTVGGEILATAVKSTRYGGVVTCCGNAASPDLPLNVYPFILRAVSLHGIDSANCALETRKKIWKKLAGDWKIANLEKLCKEISLEELNEAIDRILAGRLTGRMLVNLEN